MEDLTHNSLVHLILWMFLRNLIIRGNDSSMLDRSHSVISHRFCQHHVHANENDRFPRGNDKFCRPKKDQGHRSEMPRRMDGRTDNNDAVLLATDAIPLENNDNNKEEEEDDDWRRRRRLQLTPSPTNEVPIESRTSLPTSVGSSSPSLVRVIFQIRIHRINWRS